MDKIWEALDRLDGGRRWIKGSSYRDGSRCILGALGDSTNQMYIHWSQKDAETEKAVAAVAEVIRSQFPERIPYSPMIPLSVCRIFNDHSDTTWDEMRTVLEKAAIQHDEILS